MNERELAYHEAGHAVVRCLLRLPFKRVTIIPTDENLGQVAGVTLPEGYKPESDRGPKTRDRTEREIMARLAGMVAEGLLAESEVNAPGAWKDRQNAVDLAEFVTTSAEEAEAYTEWLLCRTRNLLSLPWNWAAVQAVAQALLAERELGARRVRSIVKEAIARYQKHQETGNA